MQLLEHIHIDVRSLAETENFLRTALPEIQRRGSGNGAGSLNSHPYRRRVYYIDGNGLDREYC